MVVEPAETLQLPKHVPDRAIKVRFDDAAARERLAELGGTIRRSRWRSGRCGTGKRCSIRNPEEHDLLEIVASSVDIPFSSGFLSQRKNAHGSGAGCSMSRPRVIEFGAVGRAPSPR